MKIINDDSKIYLRNYLFNNSIDSLVTDPPAFISFMGKEWDGFDKLNHISGIFKECYRVLKPGAYGVVWALPRTSHHTAKALEDSGFEIRDIIHHVFGTGFPKSHNISKGFDKKAGAERVNTGILMAGHSEGRNPRRRSIYSDIKEAKAYITIPATDLAKKYEGFGTALKPAVEHWILVRKPLSEKTVVDNVEKWGTGGLNIDGCRVEAKDQAVLDAAVKRMRGNESKSGIRVNDKPVFIANKTIEPNSSVGRFPANLVHDGSEEVEREFLEQSEKMGMHNCGNKNENGLGGFRDDYVAGDLRTNTIEGKKFYTQKENNTASRFFNSLPPDEKTPGRFPANLTHDGSEEVEREFLEQGGASKSQIRKVKTDEKVDRIWEENGGWKNRVEGGVNDSGSAARFFNSLPDEIDSTFIYQAKASTRERNEGLEGFPLGEPPASARSKPAEGRASALGQPRQNSHPTVKSIALMSHLIKLTTPPNGICLDPFMGSGSTGVACVKNGFDFIGIEQNKEYFEIAKARIESSKIIS